MTLWLVIVGIVVLIAVLMHITIDDRLTRIINMLDRIATSLERANGGGAK